MIENIESITYDNIELLNDSAFIKQSHDRIDSHINNIKEQLITAIAIRCNQISKLDLRDILVKDIEELLENFRIEFKKGIAVLSHLSDVENKANLATAISWYATIDEKITNELYQVLTILINKINTLE